MRGKEEWKESETVQGGSGEEEVRRGEKRDIRGVGG